MNTPDIPGILEEVRVAAGFPRKCLDAISAEARPGAGDSGPGPAASVSLGKGFGAHPLQTPNRLDPCGSQDRQQPQYAIDSGMIAQNCLLECGPLGLGNRFPTPPSSSERLFVQCGAVWPAALSPSLREGVAGSLFLGMFDRRVRPQASPQERAASPNQRRPWAGLDLAAGDWPGAESEVQRESGEAVTHRLCIATVSITAQLPKAAVLLLLPQNIPTTFKRL